jgi:predicted transcriptional regulator
VLLREDTALAENDLLENVYELLNRAQIPFMTKEKLYRLLKGKGSREEKLSTIHSTYMDEGIRQAVTELLTAWYS